MPSEPSSQNQSDLTEQVKADSNASLKVTLGDYRLIRKLGSGGMGTVYEAVHARLEKQVAVKVLASNRLKDADSVARFEREMKAVGKLNHPNIIQAFDAREENGTHFLVLEFIDGADLGEVSKDRGKIPVADACEMIRQAAAGLQNAHEHGLVHRDIKPSNLLLALSRNSDGQVSNAVVKVLDLGLALLSGEGHGEELTSTGQVMGTLDYIAPEQIQDTHKVDIRADLYALGCTLYKLLSGKAPFADSRGAIKKMRAHADLEAPDIKTIRPDIPDGLAEVVHKLLTKSPSERFDTPADLAAALQPYCTGANLAAIGNSLPERDMQTIVLEEGTVDGIIHSGGTETIAKPTVPNDLSSDLSNVSEPSLMLSNDDSPETRVYSPKEKKRSGGRWIGLIAIVLICVPVGYYLISLSFSDSSSDSPEQNKNAAIPPINDSPNFALSFDGLDDHVLVESLSLNDIDLSQPLTIELSAKIRAYRTSNLVSWLGDEWIAVFHSGERWGVGRLRSEKPFLFEGSTPATVDQWTKIAAVWDGTDWTLFIDGTQQTTIGNGFDLEPTSGGLYIGGVPMELLTGHSGGRWFAGDIDEIRISDTIRYPDSTYELTDRFTTDKNTLLLFHFDEQAGDTVKDSSGNGNNGTIVGATRVEL